MATSPMSSFMTGSTSAPSVVTPPGTSPSSSGSSIPHDATGPDTSRYLTTTLDGEEKDEQEREKERRKKVADLLAAGRKEWRRYADADSRNRDEALDDLKFYVSEQWASDIKNMRNIDGRPCLTINRLPQFINQVANEERQQRPAIQVDPLGDGATKETAEIIQGIIRHIETQSWAEVAYDQAFTSAAKIGIGYYRIVVRYLPHSFNQEIYVEPVSNPFSVYRDPASRRPDYTDANGLFIITDIDRKTFEADYPDAEMATASDWTAIGNQVPDWADSDTCRVAEWYRVETVEKKLYQMEDGTTYWEEELLEAGLQVTDAKRTRMEIQRQIHWYKFNAIEILDDLILPGTIIPVIPVYGDMVDINGELKLMGLIRNAKDPQRMYNYWVSAQTEMIALAPRAPFILAEGQAEGHETEWRQANRRNLAYLEYKMTSINNQIAPPPERQQAEPPIGAISAAVRQADNDLKSTTGIYDASLGAPGPEQSGKAIGLRQQAGHTSNFHFADNMKRAITIGGRVILQYIPVIYDTDRMVRIVYPDETIDMIRVMPDEDRVKYIANMKAQMAQQQAIQAGANGVPPSMVGQAMGAASPMNGGGASPFPGGIDPELKKAISKIYSLDIGRYDVTVTSGSSYQTRRQEAAASMASVIQAYPKLMEIAGDLFVSNMDWPGAKEIAARLKKALPPMFHDDDDQPPIPPQMQAQMMQQSQVIQALTKEITDLTNKLEGRIVEAQSQEKRVALQENTKLNVAMLKVDHEKAMAGMQQEMQNLSEMFQAKLEKLAADRETALELHRMEVDAQQQQQQANGGGGPSGPAGPGGPPTPPARPSTPPASGAPQRPTMPGPSGPGAGAGAPGGGSPPPIPPRPSLFRRMFGG